MNANADEFARSEGAAASAAAPSATDESVSAENDCSGARSRPSSGDKAYDGSNDGSAAKGKVETSWPRKPSQSMKKQLLPDRPEVVPVSEPKFDSRSTKISAVVPSLPDRPEVVPVSEPNFAGIGGRNRPSPGRKAYDSNNDGSPAKRKGEFSPSRLPEPSGSTKNSAVDKSLPDRPEVVPVSGPDFHSPSSSTAPHTVSGPPAAGGGGNRSIRVMPLLPSTDVAGIEVEVDEVVSEEERSQRPAENDVTAAVPGFLVVEAGRRGGEEELIATRERMLQDAPLVYGEVEVAESGGKSWLRKHSRLVAAASFILILAAIAAAVLTTKLPSSSNNDTNGGELHPSQGDESAEVEKGDGAPLIGNISSIAPQMLQPSICSSDRCRSIQSVLAPLVANSSSLEDPSSPQARALLWLADEDVRRVESLSDAFTLTQRFAVATVYFATGGGDNMWREEANFLSGEHVCEWHAWAEESVGAYDDFSEKGVSCHGANVVFMLNLAHNNLIGSIPEEISLLPFLEILWMYDNKIGGTIPGAISLLNYLQLLSLGVNRLEGTVPNMSSSLVNVDLSINALNGPIPTLTSLTKLEHVSLAYNYLTSTLPSFSANPDMALLWLSSNNLEGPLSPSVNNLTTLQVLSLQDNSITGTIPFKAELPLETLNLHNNLMNGTIDAAIDHIPNVSNLILSWNSFTGTLPDRLWELTNVEYVGLNNNLLSGTLSPQVSNLNRTLLSLTMRMNLMNGTIPPSIVELTNLEAGLVLSENSFDGSIPEDIGRLEKVQTLSLWANNLTGTLPSSIGNITDMNVLWLTMNALTGTVPRSFAQLTNLNFMSIDRNALTGNIDFLCDLGMKLIEADCLGGPENSSSLIECSCCGRCCNAAAGVCDPPYSSSGL